MLPSYRLTPWQWWSVFIAVASTCVPLVGVTAVMVTPLVAQLWAQCLPSRRNMLAVVLATLPMPVAPFAPLWSLHPWWQRVVLGVALSTPWWPTPPYLAWSVVALGSIGAVWYAHQRDALRWYGPLLVLMAHHAPPLYFDVVVLSVFGIVTLWSMHHQQMERGWMALAGALLWSMTAPGLVVAPWAMTVAQMPQIALLAVVSWWGVAATTLAAGSLWGSVLVLWPLLANIPQITWRQLRAWAPFLVLWWAAPNLAGIARLQPALTPFGDIVVAWWVRAANQQVVSGLPVAIIGWVLVLAWAVVQQWPVQERDDAG
jgi:hypothetical protein